MSAPFPSTLPKQTNDRERAYALSAAVETPALPGEPGVASGAPDGVRARSAVVEAAGRSRQRGAPKWNL